MGGVGNMKTKERHISMYEIDTEDILLNILAQKRIITSKDLMSFSIPTETKYKEIFFDLSADSVYFIYERKPNIFRWTPDGVVLSEQTSEDELMNLVNAINDLMPENVVVKLNQSIKQLQEK